jgi:hypothetical protein
MAPGKKIKADKHAQSLSKDKAGSPANGKQTPLESDKPETEKNIPPVGDDNLNKDTHITNNDNKITNKG